MVVPIVYLITITFQPFNYYIYENYIMNSCKCISKGKDDKKDQPVAVPNTLKVSDVESVET